MSFTVETGLFLAMIMIASLKVDGKTADWREQLTMMPSLVLIRQCMT